MFDILNMNSIIFLMMIWGKFPNSPNWSKILKPENNLLKKSHLLTQSRVGLKNRDQSMSILVNQSQLNAITCYLRFFIFSPVCMGFFCEKQRLISTHEIKILWGWLLINITHLIPCVMKELMKIRQKMKAFIVQ